MSRYVFVFALFHKKPRLSRNEFPFSSNSCMTDWWIWFCDTLNDGLLYGLIQYTPVAQYHACGDELYLIMFADRAFVHNYPVFSNGSLVPTYLTVFLEIMWCS